MKAVFMRTSMLVFLLLSLAFFTTINNTQTNNIQLNNYGKENLSHITDSLKSNLIKKKIIPKLMVYIFNDQAPENKNIYIYILIIK